MYTTTTTTIMAAAMDQGNSASQNPSLIDELEASFLNCLSLLTSQEYFNIHDSDETRTSIENGMQKFLDLSRQTEAFFLRKKMLVSFQKPEQYLNDDIMDLKLELAKKEQLLERHAERLKRCQMMLQTGTGTGGQPVQQAHAPSQQQSHPQLHPHQAPPQHQMGGSGPIPQYSPHLMQQMAPQGPGMGHFQGYPASIHTPPMQGQPSGMQPPPMGMGPRAQAPPSYPQGPLAYLEQTTSNIGMPDRR